MKNYPPEVYWVALASVGGMARYLSTYKKANGRFAMGAFFVASFISGFSGLMFALFGEFMGLHERAIFMMAGVGGFMGENAVRYMIEYLSNKFKN